MSWCWHRWTKWKKLREGQVGGEKEKPNEPGDYFVEQQRECEKCGIIQLRTEWA